MLQVQCPLMSGLEDLDLVLHDIWQLHGVRVLTDHLLDKESAVLFRVQGPAERPTKKSEGPKTLRISGVLLRTLDRHLKKRRGDRRLCNGLKWRRAGQTPARICLEMAQLVLGLVKGMFAIDSCAD